VGQAVEREQQTSFNKLPVEQTSFENISNKQNLLLVCHHHRSELKLNSTVSKLHTTHNSYYNERAVNKKDLLLRGFENKYIFYRFNITLSIATAHFRHINQSVAHLAQVYPTPQRSSIVEPSKKDQNGSSK